MPNLPRKSRRNISQRPKHFKIAAPASRSADRDIFGVPNSQVGRIVDIRTDYSRLILARWQGIR
jgi:hypothetical protein